MLRQTRSYLFLLTPEEAVLTVDHMTKTQDFAATATAHPHHDPSQMADLNPGGGKAKGSDPHR
jgi:hypothetical protein